MKPPVLRYAKTTIMGHSWWSWKCDWCHPEGAAMVDSESIEDAQRSCPYRQGAGHWFPPVPPVPVTIEYRGPVPEPSLSASSGEESKKGD